MFPKSDPTVRRRDATAAHLAILSVSIEVERRVDGLLAESEVRRTSQTAHRRPRLGWSLLPRGPAVSGVELQHRPAGHHAG